jgi:acyl carrier protein
MTTKTIDDILAGIRPEFDFRASSDFLGDGLLDSLDLVTLVAELDRGYGIQIPGVEIVPENFQNLEAITALVERHGGRP